MFEIDLLIKGFGLPACPPASPGPDSSFIYLANRYSLIKKQHPPNHTPRAAAAAEEVPVRCGRDDDDARQCDTEEHSQRNLHCKQ